MARIDGGDVVLNFRKGFFVSIIIALKDGNTVVLGADSRFMTADFAGVHSDRVPKIYPIGSDGFIAANGFKLACDFQQTRAPELARELGTADIEAIGEALACESLLVMRELVSALNSAISSDPARYENMRQAVSGETLLHTCTLVGRNSHHETGYVTLSFVVAKTGEVIHETVAYFGRARRLQFCAGDPALRYMMPKLSRDNRVRDWRLVPAARLVLSAAKANSSMIGGPSQIAIVSGDGATWVDRPPAQNEALPEVSSAGASMGCMTASFTSTVTLEQAGGGPQVQLTSAEIALINGSNEVVVEASSVTITGGGATLTVDSTGITGGIVNCTSLNCTDAAITNISSISTLGLTFGTPSHPGVIVGYVKIGGAPMGYLAVYN